MNLFDNENEIIEFFKMGGCEEVLFLNNNISTNKIFKYISKPKHWKNWICSSGKDEPPPDYYSDKYKLMMEVMRIDDHAFKNKKGKLVNPVNIRESEIQAEIRKHAKITGTTKIIVNAVSGLPTREDHNYDFYLKNFSRVINNHKESVELYRSNHKGYKLIFFLFDESSAYVRVDTKELADRGAKHGEMFIGDSHRFFLDKAFVDVIKECGADYVVWYTPFKYIDTHGVFPQLPKVIVIDVKNLDELNYIESYDPDYIMSCEE